MSGSAIRIHRFRLQINVPGANRASHQAINRRFTRVVERRLEPQLANVLAPLDKADECVVLIKKLELNVDIDLSLDEEHISRLIAESLKKQLIKNLGNREGNNILVFANAATYLKHFLLDVVAGRAFQSWYYRQFSGLGALPLSAAIRTALLDEKKVGIAALGGMTDIELVKLCQVMTPADAQQLLTECSTSDAGLDFPALLQVLHESQNVLSPLIAVGKTQAIFYLTTRYLRHSSGSISPLVMDYCRLCVQMIRLADTYPKDRDKLFLCIKQKNLQALTHRLTAQEISDLVPVMAIADDQLIPLFKVFSQETSSLAPVLSAAQSAARFTWFGNALLLLRQLSEFPLEAMVEDWPAPEQQSAAAIMRLLTISICQGASRAGLCFRDPLVQSLCGITRDCYLEDAVEWLQQINDDQRQRAKQRWIKTIAAGTVEVFYWDNADIFTLAPETTVCLYQTQQKGQWLSIFADPAKVYTAAIAAADPQENDRQRRELLFLWPAPWLARGALQLSPQMLELLVMMAQGLLKSFAYRLPGFAGSSAPYLLTNFLSMSLTLREEADHFTAEISRVPLNVILNMTGINRGRVTIPTFDPRSIYLEDVQ